LHFLFSLLVGFIDDEFPGIDEQHHHHSSGKNVVGVISRSLCECHINAQPRSLLGLACELEGRKLLSGPVARVVASDPR
jgi:hypothetical protein